MIFLGNYIDYITPEIMNAMKNRTGDVIPVWQPDKWKDHPMLDSAREKTRSGYAERGDVFHQYTSSSPDMNDIDVIVPPLGEDVDRKCYWWFIKLLPGQFQPMHFDPQLVYAEDPERYTLFLQDWQPGHIYQYDDKMISNYKAGDLYRWSDPMCLHGAVNIGFESRYTLQITTYKFISEHL